MKSIQYYTANLILLLALSSSTLLSAQDPQPNVILVLTDDQGIGDLSCHGNPWIKTPNLDAFYEEALRLTDFHVSPVCTPTRSALMTGRYPINNGAWATYKGRDALSEGALTMAEVFRHNGYRTGIFGKWHLGDNYPVRPSDCGFDLSIIHKAGGVGELSDYWGNSYFDDVYYVNNEPRQFEGYCTDVWFDEAMKFIDNSGAQPFFAYIPTNAPHSPFVVEERYAAPYQHLVGEDIVGAEFYGMLVNIDENFGRLEKYLQDHNLAENTILIFMTDNGSGGGRSRDGQLGFNQGFRGMKGDKTEGGHRVPFFIRWPRGKIEGGRDLVDLTAHIDVLPTLTGLCGLKMPDKRSLDGVDVSPLMLPGADYQERARTVFVHHRQDWRPPLDEDQTCIMTERWRLVHGDELYDIDEDRYQEHNLASQFPQVVQKMLEQNAAFISMAKTTPEYQAFPVNIVGNQNQKEIKLTIQHAIGEGGGIWKVEHVAAGMKNVNNTHALKIEQDGTYRISCRRWPQECPGPILGIPKVNPKNMYKYQTISPDRVQIQVSNQMWEQEIAPEDEEVSFEVDLERGKTFLVNDFVEGEEKYGVYYTYISFVGKE